MKKRIRGLNPTIRQAMVLQQNSMDHRDWLIRRTLKKGLECIHRQTGDLKTAEFNTVAE